MFERVYSYQTENLGIRGTAYVFLEFRIAKISYSKLHYFLYYTL